MTDSSSDSGFRQRHIYANFEDRSGMESRDDRRFKEPKQDPPLGAIALAIGLLISGSVLLLFGCLILTDNMHGKPGAGLGLTILGSLTFLPGFYQTRIAYCTWKGYRGFKYSSIPTLQ